MRPLFSIALLCTVSLSAQTANYTKNKAAKLAVPSPFEAIIEGKTDQVIAYQDNLCVAFTPLRKQAPVHLLIVPKKRITTLNETAATDAELIGHLVIVAKKLAQELGIAESGYRLTFNTNEDSGQSVFHIHLHLLGGMKLGPMLPQTYVDPKPGASEG